MSDEELIKKYISKEKQEEALDKLKQGYPVQYLIGDVDFYGFPIKVNASVLIPRFETEYLIEKTIKYLAKLDIKNPQVLEIGTGSGCISIALKKLIDCHITALDISKKALDVAIKNAKLNQVLIDFIHCDIAKYQSNAKFSLIISNPPYVPIDSPVDEKIKYEPQIAIYAQDNGVYFYKVILDKLKNNLEDNYLIAFEIGDKEALLIKEIVIEYLPKAYIKVEKDYNNYERYLFISSKKLSE